jgi:hypothetical protein
MMPKNPCNTVKMEVAPVPKCGVGSGNFGSQRHGALTTLPRLKACERKAEIEDVPRRIA